jgi:paraquat-inducible protein A
MNSGILVACHDCALVQRIPTLPKVGLIRCKRCSALLFRSSSDNIDRPFALYVAALIFFILANSFPLLTLKFEGRIETTTLIGGVVTLYRQGMIGLALLVFLTTVLVPFLQLSSAIWALVALKFQIYKKSLPRLLRLFVKSYPWGMLEVFMLGIFVAVVKLADMAGIVMGAGAYCFGGLIFITAAATSSMDLRLFWERIALSPSAVLSDQVQRAPLISCHSCHFLSKVPQKLSSQSFCPRCGEPLHPRKVDSLSRTWALVLAAAILYIPANMLPVMRTVSMGSEQNDTILSGVIYLMVNDMWPLALVIFVASVFVPMMKLVVLIYLLLSVQLKSIRFTRDRTFLYRIIETAGRWSMVDVYVVTILVALVKMGSMATVEAQAGMVAFAAVVVLTMLATSSFDPRLIWDVMEKDYD